MSCRGYSNGASKVRSILAFGETSGDGFEKACAGVLASVLEGGFERGLGEAFGRASEGASRTAPHALQVALGNCVSPHVEHFTP